MSSTAKKPITTAITQFPTRPHVQFCSSVGSKRSQKESNNVISSESIKKFENRIINANCYNFTLRTSDKKRSRKHKESDQSSLNAELLTRIPHIRINYQKLINRFSGRYKVSFELNYFMI